MNEVVSQERGPHASLDINSRVRKAKAIERLLGLDPTDDQVLSLLEVGTGAGVIAQHFATHPDIAFSVAAVDVIDQRVSTKGYEFKLVDSALLPYDDASFDVVISNHVIEHVGARSHQRTHLTEIGRVLKPDGVGYLATPNRWAVVEPHFGLPFLSWLPAGEIRSRYVRLLNRGDVYDCNPLSLRNLRDLTKEAGLKARHLELRILLDRLRLREVDAVHRATADGPSWLPGALAAFSPTLVALMTK